MIISIKSLLLEELSDKYEIYFQIYTISIQRKFGGKNHHPTTHSPIRRDNRNNRIPGNQNLSSGKTKKIRPIF